jgi:hypothetical protein
MYYTNISLLKKIILSTIIASGLMLHGCSNNTSKQTKAGSNVHSKVKSLKTSADFREFLKKFKVLSLPLTIKTLEIVVDSSRKLNTKDNIFIKSEYPNEIYAYGILPDTLNSFKIIWLQPAEEEVPVLTTFTKNGKKINEEYLGVGGCGSDCCFTCKEFITINHDLSIFSADSIKSCECDSTGPKENTTKKYIRYKTGKILKSGKIDITDILEKPVS